MTTITTPTIYFDEAGNTGQDLLNDTQKIFVLSSVKFTEDESSILSSIFDEGNEIHFVKLKNSEKGRNQIIEFLNNNLINEANIILSYANKHFVASTQIIDQLIEPVLFSEGKDLYKNGMNIVYSNVFYYLGMHKWNRESFEQILNLFISMYRSKSPESIKEFYDHIEIFSKSIEEMERVIFFDPILKNKDDIHDTLEIVTKFTLDSTLSTFLVLSDYWFKKLDSKIKVVFDQSKQIDYYQDYIDYMRTMQVEMKDVGYGDAKMTFPSQIESLDLVSSIDEINLQLADLIASSTTFALGNENPKQEKFREQIQTSNLFKLRNCHAIWPKPNFSSESLKRENDEGDNILDFLASEAIKKSL